MIKSLRYDGYKARLEDFPAESWTQVLGTSDKKEALISVVRRCLNFRVNTISGIPWKMTIDGGDTLFDSSNPVEKKYKWLKPIINNIRRIETSLIYKSEAFYSLEDQRLLDPRTIKVVWDTDYGITHFERKINNKTTVNIDPDLIVYIPVLDISETEPTPSILDTVKLDSEVIRSIDNYITQYFNGGTIKATIVTSKENSYPIKDEVDRIETFLNRQLKGVSNAFKSVFFRTPIETTVVGSGLEDFDPKLLDAKIMSVIMAFEVPASAILPSAANYATAISDKRLFYESVGVDRINFIYDQINDQYLNDLGLSLIAEPEKLSVFQEDENQRSQSLINLVNAGFSTLDAADILGYDLSDETRSRLESSEVDMMNRLSVVPPLMLPDMQMNNTDNGVINDKTQKYYYSL